jgi:hypothetical protein
MRIRPTLVLCFLLTVFPVMEHQEPPCDAPELSPQEIKNIIDRERAARDDLPPAFPKFRWVVNKQGCHYTYVEYALPLTPDRNHVFRLNQHGVIIDADSDNFKCPERVFTESELAEIVSRERGKRRNLPPPFARQETRVNRARCMYLYFEHSVPRKKGHYQVFTIDPFGEVIEVQRGKREQEPGPPERD